MDQIDGIGRMKYVTKGRRAARRPRHARTGGWSPAHSAIGLALLAAVGVALATGPGGPTGVAARAAVPPSVGTTAPQPVAADTTADSQSADSGSASSVALAEAASASSTSPRGGVDASLAAIADDFPASGLAASGIPITALAAYEEAAARESQLMPNCGLSWPLLAGIGRVESDHGRFAGAILHSDGLSTPPVVGIPLNGNGTALIGDTDGGALDGDAVYDRAVGPMQFIPSTWAGWGVDANRDGVKDPFNIFDAAAAAADYLCAAGRDLTTVHGQVQAILSYNWSWDYVATVMGIERVYASAAIGVTVPILPTSPDPRHGRPAHHPPLPPVDPGKPRGTGPPGSPDPSPTSNSPSPKPSHSTTGPGPQPSSTGASSSSSSPTGGGSSSSSPTGGGSSSSSPTGGGSSSSSPTGGGSSSSSSSGSGSSSSSSESGSASTLDSPCAPDTSPSVSATSSSCPAPSSKTALSSTAGDPTAMTGAGSAALASSSTGP